MTHPVVVVGAGPTGLAAAILLAQEGVPVVVLERWTDSYPLPRAIAMDDEVQRIVARLGVETEFAAMSRRSDGMQLMDARHRVLARFDRTGVSDQTGFWRARQFDQPLLERLLRERADSFGDLVTLRRGVEVTRIEQTDAGPVALRLATGETISADYVLGCDGANSVVRTSIGAALQDLHFEQRWLVVDIDTDAELEQWPGVHQVCDTHRAATFMQGHVASRYRWEFQLRDDETVERDFGSIDQLMPLIAPWTGAVPPDRLRVVRATDYTFRAALADRWRDRRVFLLGDAAHLTPPFIGQGMAAGVRDAANLAWKVAGVVQGRLRPTVLDSYEPERRPHARAMIELSRTVGRLMTGGGRLGSVVRRVVVPAAQHLPGLRAAALDSATPALTGGPLIDGRSALAGTIVPNAAVSGGRLDTIISAQWVLLSRHPVAPSDRAAMEKRGVVVVEDALHAWLRDAGIAAAVVRPDGVVMATGPSASTLCGVIAQTVQPVPVPVPA